MNLRPVEIIVLLLVVLLLFGAKRLPDLARSMGRSLKIFKSEVTDLRDDSPTTPSGTTAPTGTPAATTSTTTPSAVPDTRDAGTTPPHGDPAVGVLPADTSDRKQA